MSQKYLHTHPEFGPQIRALRATLARQPLPDPSPGEPSLVAVLRAKIHDQQDQIAALQGEVRRLEHNLAVALGQQVQERGKQ